MTEVTPAELSSGASHFPWIASVAGEHVPTFMNNIKQKKAKAYLNAIFFIRYLREASATKTHTAKLALRGERLELFVRE